MTGIPEYVLVMSGNGRIVNALSATAREGIPSLFAFAGVRCDHNRLGSVPAPQQAHDRNFKPGLEPGFFVAALQERFRKSVKRFSDKKRDKTKT